MFNIDRKLYQYIYDLVLRDKPELKEDTISDFIAYELPYIKIKDKTYILNSFKNHCKDMLKYDKVIINNKVSFRKKKEIIDDDEYDVVEYLNNIQCDSNHSELEERIINDEENIKKIEIIINYIKKLPTHERELFKQYYLNNVSTRKLAAMYKINYNKIYKKVRKYKEDINNINEIEIKTPEIILFMNDIKSRKYIYNVLDALKITNYHILLFRYKDNKYDTKELSIYQMIEDIKKFLK